jgi:hypothetical protein
MNGYQWTVLFAAWLGWGFDVFDGLLFNYVAPACVPVLLGIPLGTDEARSATLFWGGLLTSLRFASRTTTLPRSSASSIAERFAIRSITCRSGRRSAPRGYSTRDGFASLRSASIDPKSVTAETRTRPSVAARGQDLLVWSRLEPVIPNVAGVVTAAPQTLGAQWRQRGIYEEIHRAKGKLALPHRLRGVLKCLLDVLAPKVGYALRISSVLIPSATMSTTVATGMRSPRMHGTPPSERGPL